MSVAKKIKMYLVEHDITQKSIADVTGISPVKLNLSLNDERRLGFDELALILGALGETADKFIDPVPPKEGSEREWPHKN